MRDRHDERRLTGPHAAVRVGGRRLAAVAMLATTTVAVVAGPPLVATRVSHADGLVAHVGQVDAGGRIGHIGIDLDGSAFGYELVRYWDASGHVDDTQIPGAPAWARFEFYPDSHAYDPWASPVGGVHVQRDPAMGGAWLDLGDITLPQLGVATADGAVGFRVDGAIVAAGQIPDGRVQIDAFQLGVREPDPSIPLPPRNANGVEMGAFATSSSRANRWTAGVGWPGRYVLFVRDTATGTDIQAIADLAPGRIPTIDLDAVCFGFATCQYDRGAPRDVSGAFHPVAPARLVDTRAGTGIRNGPVRTGGGWSASPVRSVRNDEVLNHEVRVTGRWGIPSTGVSAVLLNVTAVDAPAWGYLSARPRRPSCCGELAIHDDRSAQDPAAPATSNVNVAPLDAVANLVLVRVGAGGTINLFNSLGPTHVIVDVAGWFDAGPVTGGSSGYVPVTPRRALDTRPASGGAVGPLPPGSERSVDPGPVPPGTTAVVLNLTATRTAGAGFVRAWPDGAAMPTVSNLNFTAGSDRANLAVVPLGSDGRVTVRVDDAAADLVVDVVGAFAPGGTPTTAVEPTRVADSRSGAGVVAGPVPDGGAATVRVAGVGPVPPGATAAVVNVTATRTRGAGYLTVTPAGAPEATTSNLNVTASVDVPNLAIVPLGADGAITVRAHGTSTDVLVDVLGYLAPPGAT